MEKKYIENKETNYERICKLYGRCGNMFEFFDPTKITLFGLHCLSKHNPKAS